jgi:predicted nucleic acid-binding Zn ribbon protein
MVARKRKGHPQRVGGLVADFLEASGLAGRVGQASVIPQWATLVGSQIAGVTTPLSVTADGTLFVGVTTNAWMTELALLEPQILSAINREPGRVPVKKIRWQVRR